MKLSEQYTEIVGVTHLNGVEECHDVMPKVIRLEAEKLDACETGAKWMARYKRLEAENERLREFAQDMIRRAGYDISVDEALGGE